MWNRTIIFWLLLDLLLVGLSGILTVCSIQVNQVLLSLFAAAVLWTALMSSGVRWLSQSFHIRWMRTVNLVSTFVFGAFCFFMMSGQKELTLPSDPNLALLFTLFIGTSLVHWLLIKAQAARIQLSSLYRLGCLYGGLGIVFLLIQIYNLVPLSSFQSSLITFFCGLGIVFSIDVFVMQLQKLIKGWSAFETDHNPLGTLLWLFFSTHNPVHSFFNTLHHQLGVDFRSSWALVVLRRSIEPVVLFSVLLGWISTSLVTVEPHQKAVVERLGVPLEQPLEAGLKFVFPWPIDQVYLVDTERVFTMNIGHEEEGDSEENTEEAESILWANQHADEEYTLLLGDGHDLISADGVLQYRIQDPIQYLYAEHQPESRLRSIAYRALMHETAHRTLDDALSENLIELAQSVTQRIQADVATQVPCLKTVSFSFRALHPPVAVAEAYQSVVSSQIDRQTRVIRAEAYRKSRIPTANAEKMAVLSEAKGFAFKRKAEAVGEAYAFEGLYATVYSDVALYEFRRAQETLSEQLKGKKVVVVDHRIEQEGATLWIKE